VTALLSAFPKLQSEVMAAGDVQVRYTVLLV